MEEARAVAERLIENVEKVIVGKRQEVELAVMALLCQGHVLIEDVPGVGKTMLARSHRPLDRLHVQAHPVHPGPAAQRRDRRLASSTRRQREFEFRPGPVMAQIVLADEINRATPKTQSALLEAMEERQVTVDGVTRPAARALPGAGHPEPDRVRGHLPPARGAARPLPDARSAWAIPRRATRW